MFKLFLTAAALALPTLATADVTPFKTPSGNIECYIGTGEGPPDLTCTIHQFSGTPNVPRPASCNGPWGHTYILLARGRVRMECGGPGGKNTAPGVDVAPYGVSADWGGISCHSARTGLRCQNADGHGFHLSRRNLGVF
ncbi:DUF6636 domain-containing protein [Salipiger mucosus]|uniref:Ig-like domain-containing protein n=1 Tax=Salipiger mucosus DSM 16094 TaxID=1123237 RepID=S9QZJ5_9RHOB|nr:DUF6636 domain-containing protein [Salipiger mucosus]EPX86816.1 hypothetical protein Salmuc_01465 [Salipiger mucosus DSM 16094]